MIATGNPSIRRREIRDAITEIHGLVAALERKAERAYEIVSRTTPCGARMDIGGARVAVAAIRTAVVDLERLLGAE
jgi:hypothetical protein